MIKVQQLHDHIVASGLIKADSISVIADDGQMEWVFSPNDNSYEINYTANLLIRDFPQKIPLHYLFFIIGSFFDENDSHRHNNFPTFRTSLLNQAETDLEFTFKFNEIYEYNLVDTVEEADLSVSNLFPYFDALKAAQPAYKDREILHLKLDSQQDKRRIHHLEKDGYLMKFYLKQDHEHHL